MPALFTVFGASTDHGRAVVDALLMTSQYTVRAVVTSPTDIDGAEVICMTSPCNDVIDRAVAGADICYVSTRTDFTASDCAANELNEGKTIADACLRHSTHHVILTTQLSPRDAVALPARHCDVKAQIEKYVTSLRLPVTCVELPFLYESLYSTFPPEEFVRGSYRLGKQLGASQSKENHS